MDAAYIPASRTGAGVPGPPSPPPPNRRPKLSTPRARNGDSLSDARRFALQTVGTVLVGGCAVLTLSMRAVPQSHLSAMFAAVIYTLAAHLLLPSEQRRLAPAGRILPLASSSAVSRAVIRFFLLTSLALSVVVPWIWLVVFGATRAQQRLMAPHLFVMMTQVLFEIWSYRNAVSVVIRVGVPVAFVSYRLRVLYTWARASLRVASQPGAATTDSIMVALAVANLGFWSIMLLYVLLLKVCPPYFVRLEEAPEDDEPALAVEMPRARPLSAPACS